MVSNINPICPLDYPNVYMGYKYALKVVSGEIPNSIFVIGACKRFLDFYSKSQDPENYFWFDVKKAEKYLKQTQLFSHVKGTWSTENIKYEPWQNFIFMNIIGFRHRDGNNPLFRIAHIEVPRGNAKSAMASQCVLAYLALDNPKGNEISCVGTKRDQAKIVLKSAMAMAQKSKAYLDKTGVEVLAHEIRHAESFSYARALSNDSDSLDGLQDILAVMDELHAMDRELFEVIYSGMSKRRDSLMLCITTAGNSTDSIGYSQSCYAKKVCTGEHIDDQFFAIVYTIDEGDDIYDETTWRKANPNYGVSVDPVTFAAKANKCKITPSDVPNFKIKHLNCWISEAKAFFSTHLWDLGARPEITIDQFKGHKCKVGIDLASKLDFAPIVYTFRTKETFGEGEEAEEKYVYHFFDRTFIPQETVDNAKNVLYDEAIAKGFLIPTPGAAINYPALEKDFKEQAKLFKVTQAMYDPWNATQFAQQCTNEKIAEMVEFRMNTSNLSEATKELEALIRENRIRHNGSPLTKWCMSNVVCKEDNAGNVFPKKTNERLKIDIAIALIMTIAAWTQEEDTEPVYNQRGLRTI